MDARDWDQRYASSDLVWSSAPNQFVAAELADLPPGRALDLASGEGRNALWLAERGWQVTAVDFSRVGLDKARRLRAVREHGQALRVEWVHADVLDYDPGVATYDLSLVAYLQLPGDERRTVIQRGFTALRVGGTLLVVGHDSTNLTEGTGGPQDPSVLFTAQDVLADLTGPGGLCDGTSFHVEIAERVPRAVRAGDAEKHRGEPERTAYDALVRLVRAG